MQLVLSLLSVEQVNPIHQLTPLGSSSQMPVVKDKNLTIHDWCVSVSPPLDRNLILIQILEGTIKAMLYSEKLDVLFSLRTHFRPGRLL
jgi:hypothetical protein